MLQPDEQDAGDEGSWCCFQFAALAGAPAATSFVDPNAPPVPSAPAPASMQREDDANPVHESARPTATPAGLPAKRKRGYERPRPMLPNSMAGAQLMLPVGSAQAVGLSPAPVGQGRNQSYGMASTPLSAAAISPSIGTPDSAAGSFAAKPVSSAGLLQWAQETMPLMCDEELPPDGASARTQPLGPALSKDLMKVLTDLGWESCRVDNGGSAQAMVGDFEGRLGLRPMRQRYLDAGSSVEPRSVEQQVQIKFWSAASSSSGDQVRRRFQFGSGFAALERGGSHKSMMPVLAAEGHIVA